MRETHKRRTLFFQLRSLLGIVLLVLLAHHGTTVPSKLWLLGIGLLISDLLILLLPLSWLEEPKLPYAVFLIDSAVLTIILYRISGYDSETLLLYYLTLFMATLGQDVRKSVGIALVASVLEVGLRLGRGGSVLHDADTLTHIPLFFVTAVLCSYLAENARAYGERARQLKEAQSGLEREIARYADDLTESEQLRAEAQASAQRLRESEARYRRFLERNAAGVLRNTLDGRILDCNWSLVRMLGYDSIEDLKRHRTPELHFYPEAREVVLKRLKNEKALISNEICFKRKDGGPVWALFNASLIEGDDDRGEVLEATLIDITERKRAEEALRQSEQQYRLLFQSNPHPMWVYDLETLRFLEVNDAAIEHYGYIRDEFLAMTIKDVRPPEDVPLLLDNVATVAAGINRSGNWRHRTKNGKIIDVEITAHRMLFAGRGAELVLANDITERRLTEAENRRLAMAIEQSADGIVVTDPEGIIQYVNPAFSAMTGYTRDEALGQNPRILKSGQHGNEFYQSLWNTIRAGNVWHGEISNRRKDGTLYTEAMTIAPVRDPSGTITNFIAVKEDVSERKQLEQQFRQAQKMEAVGRLSGGIAHDFNNLLTVINGYSEIILDSMKPDDLNRNRVGEIKKSGARAASLTRQLLAFSRQQVMEPQVLDLNSVIANMDKMLRRLIGEDIDLVTVAGKDLGRVKADPGQIEQIILNLAVNARDAMSEGGKLTIETQNAELDESYARDHVAVKPGPHVMLAISDTGAGMNPETQKHIFEPFFTTKGKGKGTGLGLSTVYGIVKQSGGNIWVYTEPGKGTTFKIYLPRIDEPLEVHPPGKAEAEARSGTETVLLVEDEPAVRMLVLETVKLKGYRVLEAHNGAEALSIAAQHQGPIHLLITDVVMPEMGGRVLAERLAASRLGMKVLYMSGYTDNAIVHHGVLEPGTAFLQKPFTPEALALKVRDVLDAPAGKAS